MLPFTNLWYIGSDVLQLGGNSFYNGCSWIENNIIINENGVGLVRAWRRDGGREEGREGREEGHDPSTDARAS